MTAKTYPNASMAPDGSSYVTLTDGAGNLVTAGASGITIGSTTVTGGATTQVLFNLGGVVSSDSGFTYAGSSGLVSTAGPFLSSLYAGYGDFELFTSLAGAQNRQPLNRITGIGLDYTGMTIPSNWLFGFSFNAAGSGDIYASRDTAIGRNAAGVLEVNNGTSGTFAALKVSGLTSSTTRNDTGYGYFQPTTGQTVTLSNTAYNSIIDPAGTLANLTVNLPSTPTDGMMVTFRFSQIITALVVSGNGHSILGNPTTAALGATLTAIYKVSNTTWYM